MLLNLLLLLTTHGLHWFGDRFGPGSVRQRLELLFGCQLLLRDLLQLQELAKTSIKVTSQIDAVSDRWQVRFLHLRRHSIVGSSWAHGIWRNISTCVWTELGWIIEWLFRGRIIIGPLLAFIWGSIWKWLFGGVRTLTFRFLSDHAEVLESALEKWKWLLKVGAH